MVIEGKLQENEQQRETMLAERVCCSLDNQETHDYRKSESEL